MSAQAAVPDETVAIPVKNKRIPRKIGEVIHLVLTGECSTYKAAAERVGMHPNYVYTALKKPEIVTHIEMQTRVSLARLQAPAAGRLAHLMMNAKSEQVQKDLVIHTLAIAGIKPTADAQVSVNIGIRVAGYVIDLTDAQPMRNVSENMSSKLIDG